MSLTTKQKIDLLNDFRAGLNRTQLAEKYGITMKSLYRIMPNLEDKIGQKKPNPRITVHSSLEEELFRQIQYISEDLGKTQSTIVREMIKFALANGY